MIPPVLTGKSLAVGLLWIALLVVCWSVTLASSAAPVRLGVRGLRRQRALRRHVVWQASEPVVRWLATRLSGRVPGSWLANLDAFLLRCGDPLGLTAADLFVLGCVSAGAGLTVGVLLGPVVGMGRTLALFVVPLAAAFPYLAVAHAGAARLGRIRRRWPHVVELLALAVSAGSDLPGAVRQIIDRSVDADDDVVIELSYLLRELKLGFTRQQALTRLAQRVPGEGVAEFVGALVQAEQRGTPLAEVLRTQATAARARRTVRGEEAASRAGVKMVVPLFLVFLCILLLVLGPTLLSLTGQTPGGPRW